MNDAIKSRQRDLINRHAKLYRKWKKEKMLCIICGEREGDSRDHLPPQGLYPNTGSAENPNFLTYRVCKECNGGSSDSDYLLGVYLAWYLNQDAYVKGEEPEDPDLLALHTEAIERLSSVQEGDHRQKLLLPHVYFNEEHQAFGLNPDKLEIHTTLVKIAKAIYWLQTDGDILQKYNPAWWIFPRIDTSVASYIELHLKKTDAEIQWGDRFIAHYSVGKHENQVGGFINCSLHFYTNRKAGEGATWNLIAAPRDTIIDGESIFDMLHKQFGEDFYYEQL